MLNFTSCLPQSEYGDIYKVSLTYSEKTVSEVKVKYFDTLPPCISICVLKTGFLFAASEFGNHALYQFAVSFHGFGAAPPCSSHLAVMQIQKPDNARHLPVHYKHWDI